LSIFNYLKIGEIFVKKLNFKIYVIILVVFVTILACSGGGLVSEITVADQQGETNLEPTEDIQSKEGAINQPTDISATNTYLPTAISATETPLPTAIPATEAPVPTATPEIEGLVKEGTHLVGTDIEPGVYVGQAGEDLLDSCYWARLSNLSGSDDILANENAVGLYYLEVLPGDKALQTDCELLPLEQFPARNEFLKTLSPGVYIVGRDIDAGLYRGMAGDDILQSCYWARLSNVSGDNNILSNDNAIGQFFVEVLLTDFALVVDCEVEMVE
jgi:hypothetical protein